MEAAALCRDSLLVQVDGDWEWPAGQLEWTRRQTLEHICALGYTWQLATRARERRRIALTILPDAPIDMLVSTLYDAATVLAEVARATPPEARAYHPAGTADAAGFVAMETDELLVHTHDILEGIDNGLEPSEHLALLVLPGGPALGGAAVGQRTARPGRSRQPGRHVAVALRTSGGVGRDGPVLGPSGQPAGRPAVRRL